MMRASEPATKRYKEVCNEFPYLVILAKSATPGKVQLMVVHTIVGNKSLGEYVVAFSLVGNLDPPSLVSINIDIAFVAEGNKICLTITEVLLRAAAGDLAHSKN